MATSLAAHSSPAHDLLGGTESSSLGDGTAQDTADDCCFRLELDSAGAESPIAARADPPALEDSHLRQVLALLSSNAPQLQLQGLQLAQEALPSPTWLAQFLSLDGEALCVELMGCFSSPSVGQAAARVCAALAECGPTACDALLAADVGSMLEQRIKQPDSTLAAFEGAATIVAVVANKSSLAQRTLNRLGLMGHLVGILTDSSGEAAAARLAALRAVTSLCAVSQQAVVDFLYYNGVNTVLQTLFQSERAPSETLASVQLLEKVVAHTEECRGLMKEVGGIEVLAQVHREAASRQFAELQESALNTLATLTYNHAENTASLETASRLLGCEALAAQVALLHTKEGSHRSALAVTGVPGLPASLSLSLRLSDTSASDAGDCPLTPPIGSQGRASRASAEGSAARSRRALGTSFTKMFGTIRRYVSNKDSAKSPPTQGSLTGRSPPAGKETDKASDAWFAL